MWKWYDDLGTILAVVLTAAIVMLIAPARADERLMGFHSQHHHGRLHHWYQKLSGRISRTFRAVRRTIARRRVLNCAMVSGGR